jgi:hypothetical protein
MRLKRWRRASLDEVAARVLPMRLLCALALLPALSGLAGTLQGPAATMSHPSAAPPGRAFHPTARPPVPLPPAASPLARPGTADPGVWPAVPDGQPAVPGRQATVPGRQAAMAANRVANPAVPGGSPWSVQQTPNPAVPNSSLAAVSCTGTTACTAAGSYENDAGDEAALAERWDGTAWTVQATPSPAGVSSSEFAGVSCASPQTCVAVGASLNSAGVVQTLAERWDGSTWTVQATPNPGGATLSELSAVSCASPRACTAAGYYSNSPGTVQTLAETWNGTAWTVQATPTPDGATLSALFAISCASPRACTAVGSDASSPGAFTSTLSEAWDGKSWTVQPTPDPDGADGSSLSAISCTSPRACTAAGGYVASASGTPLALAEQWNGATWAVQPTPDIAGSTGSGFAGVSCTSATACTAAGYDDTATGTYVTLAEAWDGSTWSVQDTPSPAGGNNGLNAVSCSSADACTAVSGTVVNPNAGTSLGLAEAWDGSTWTIQGTPNLAGALPSTLVAVSCPSADACAAVGFSSNSAGATGTLAEIRDGPGWAVADTPEPAGTTFAELDAVSCTSARACTAVGSYTTSSASLPLAERWDGVRWIIQAIGVPGAGGQFSSVSCASASACTAVGSYTTASSQPASFAAAWDGTRWSLRTVPYPASGQLLGVSCASARACIAVGDAGADAWDGTSWRYLPTPEPAGSQSVTLSAVSCRAPDACTAVGSYTTETQLTLAERWDGTAWTIQATPNPDGGGEFTAVSCPSAAACTAVGVNFAATWDGTSWNLQATPTLPLDYYLSGVSCTTTGCVAVGSTEGTVVEAFGGGTGTDVTLALVTSG